MDYKEAIKLFNGLSKEQKSAFAIHIFNVLDEQGKTDLFKKSIDVAKKY